VWMDFPGRENYRTSVPSGKTPGLFQSLPGATTQLRLCRRDRAAFGTIELERILGDLYMPVLSRCPILFARLTSVDPVDWRKYQSAMRAW
jgi:hypothetical protein